MKMKNIEISSTWKDGWGRIWRVIGKNKERNNIELVLVRNPSMRPLAVSCASFHCWFILVDN